MIGDVDIEIIYIHASKVSGAKLSSIADLIEISEHPDMARSVLKKHILGRWLVRKFLINSGLPLTLSDTIKFGAFGKPDISGMPSFNISHSNDIVICALASVGKVGVDIEYVRQLPWQDYRDCFSATEWREITSAQDPCSRILKLWTVKESILKGDGRGLQIQLADVMLEAQFGCIGTDKKRWYFRPVFLQQYFCCVACEFPIKNVTLREVDV